MADDAPRTAGLDRFDFDTVVGRSMSIDISQIRLGFHWDHGLPVVLTRQVQGFGGLFFQLRRVR